MLAGSRNRFLKQRIRKDEVAMKLGPFDIYSVSGGRFQIDGGAMFGVVPKTLWQRVVEVDDRNFDLEIGSF